MRDPYDGLTRALATADPPGERAAVGAALAQYYAAKDCLVWRALGCPRRAAAGGDRAP